MWPSCNVDSDDEDFISAVNNNTSIKEVVYICMHVCSIFSSSRSTCFSDSAIPFLKVSQDPRLSGVPWIRHDIESVNRVRVSLSVLTVDNPNPGHIRKLTEA